MRKALSQREHDAIKAKLLESCRICWARYGYKKTSVAELASMAGISTGAFYTFFSSKEMLFFETANAFSKKLYALMTASKPPNAFLGRPVLWSRPLFAATCRVSGTFVGPAV